jgi:hypothetical protein
MIGFPLLLIPLAIYNIIVFLMPGVAFSETVLRLPLPSGEIWLLSLGDILAVLGVLLVLLEVIKAARPGGKYLTDHLLSLLVFVGAVAEFVMWPKFANSTFFLLVLLAMVDFFAGVALRGKRRGRAVVAAPLPSDVEASPLVPEPAHDPEPDHAHAMELEPEPVAEPEPMVETAPAVVIAPAPMPVPELEPPAAVPTAASVAESVLLDHPDPRLMQPVAASSEPAPQTAGPELHPDEPVPAAPEDANQASGAPRP